MTARELAAAARFCDGCGAPEPDDHEAAFVELDSRFLAGEGAPYASWLRATLPDLQLAQWRRDWAAVRTLYADDIVLVDHRAAGVGTLQGAGAFIDYHRTTSTPRWRGSTN